MADQRYTSNAESERQQLLNGVMNSGDKLAALLGAKKRQEVQGEQAMQQQAAKAQQDASHLQLQDLLGQQAQARNVDTAKEIATDNMGVSLGQNGAVAMTPKPPNVMAGVRQQSRDDSLVKSITSDFDTRTKMLRSVPPRAQAIADSLEKGDITTLGQLKANLPGVEFEAYRPTDAERKQILQETGAGAFEHLKNFLGGDSAELSDAQKKAYADLMRHKAQRVQEQLEGHKVETLKRWGTRMGSMSPEDKASVEDSLGLQPLNMAKSLQDTQSAAKPPTFEEWKAMKAKAKAGG